MSVHAPILMTMYADSDCAAENCEHEVECPTFDAVVCRECNATAHGSADPDDWEGPCAPCPIFGTGVPQDQAEALLGALTVLRPDDLSSGGVS